MTDKKLGDGESSTDRRRRRRIAISRLTLTLVLLGLSWRTVRYALGFPIWGDEAFVANNFLVRDFVGMIQPLEHSQVVPLGFMWIELAVTRLFGLSEWALRLMPYMAGMLAMLLFWRFAREVLDRRSVLLAVGFLGSAYYVVRHGAELKPYVGDLLISLVLTYLGWLVYRQPDGTRRWVLLIVCAASAVWMSYPSVFVSGSVGILLTCRVLVSPSPRRLALWAAYGSCLVASFAVMYVIYARPHAEASPWIFEVHTWTPAFPPVSEPWLLPLWFFKTHTGNMLAYPVGGKNSGSALTFLLVLVGCGVMWRTRRDLLLLLLGPLPLTFIAAAMQRYPYGGSARVSLYMAPAFCLLAGTGLVAVLKRWLPRRRAPGGIRIAAKVMAAMAIAGMLRDVIQPYKKLSDRENRRVTYWLAEQTGPDDQWVVYNSLENVPYAPFLTTWGGSAARFRFYLTKLAPVPIQWGPMPLEVAAKRDGRTWLIVYKDNKAPFPEDLLAAYLPALAERLGRPRRHHFDLSQPEAMDVYEYPPQGVSAEASSTSRPLRDSQEP